MKKLCLVLAVCFVCMGLYTYSTDRENQRLKLAVDIFKTERTYFVETINELNRLPTYEQGCKDTLIKMGGPQQPGAYRDGWDAAMELASGGYSEGYHNAIQQFGYMKPDTTKYLAEIRKLDSKQPNETTSAK